MTSTRSLTFIDLFAGIGGMRMGFEKAGWKCVFTCEMDRGAFATYQQNFPDCEPGRPFDIRQLDPAKLPACDAIVAGWPCQPFSRAGKQLGFLDPGRGDLFFEIIRLASHLQPRCLFLENVPNLASHRQGETLQEVIRALEDIGYSVTHRILDAARYTAQHRRRIYLVAMPKGAKFDWRLPPTRRTLVLADILHFSGEVTSHTPTGSIPHKYTLGLGTWQALQAHSARHAGKGNGFGFSLARRQEKTRTLSARYFKDGAEILVPGRPRPRRLTPRECARLMGFPDTFSLYGSDTQSYRQLGNSVAVPLIAALAKNLRVSLRKAENKKS